MRKLFYLLAIPAFAQLSTIQHTELDPLLSNLDGQRLKAKLTVASAPNCRLTRGGVTYGMMRRTYCIGVTGSDCDVTSAAGIVSIQLVPNDAGTTPTGCYYNASYKPLKGEDYTETWVVTAATPVPIKDVRTSIVPSPSSNVLGRQVRGTPGCAYFDSNGVLTTTGLACPPTNQVSMDTTTGHTTDCVTRTAVQHGFSSGGLVAWAVDEGTGEVLRPSVDTNIATTRTVTACFATGLAPASWTLNIFGAPGSGLPTITLLSGDQTIPAATHTIFSINQTWACYDSVGAEFDCLVTVNPTTFAARIQHTPFSAGAYAVPIGR